MRFGTTELWAFAFSSSKWDSLLVGQRSPLTPLSQLGGGGRSSGSGMVGWSGTSVGVLGVSQTDVSVLVEEAKLPIAVGLDWPTVSSALQFGRMSKFALDSDSCPSSLSRSCVSLLNFQGKRERTEVRFVLCVDSLLAITSGVSPSAKGERPAQWRTEESLVCFHRFHKKMATIIMIMLNRMTPIIIAARRWGSWCFVSEGFTVDDGFGVASPLSFFIRSPFLLVGYKYDEDEEFASSFISAQRGLHHSCP